MKSCILLAICAVLVACWLWVGGAMGGEKIEAGPFVTLKGAEPRNLISIRHSDGLISINGKLVGDMSEEEILKFFKETEAEINDPGSFYQRSELFIFVLTQIRLQAEIKKLERRIDELEKCNCVQSVPGGGLSNNCGVVGGVIVCW